MKTIKGAGDIIASPVSLMGGCGRLLVCHVCKWAIVSVSALPVVRL